MKSMAFCGEGKKRAIVEHVSKSSVHIFFDWIYEMRFVGR